MEAAGVEKWLETTKRGLGLYLCLDGVGRLLVSGVEAESSASRVGIAVGSELHSINDETLQPGDGGQSAVTALLATAAHRRVRVQVSAPEPGSARAWLPFAEFAELAVGEACVTIEHCSHCAEHAATTRHQANNDAYDAKHGGSDHCCYAAMAELLADTIESMVPNLAVVLKPIPSKYDEDDDAVLRRGARCHGLAATAFLAQPAGMAV